MQSEICEDKNGDFWIPIPFDDLISIGWSEGSELILEKWKKCIIISLK